MPAYRSRTSTHGRNMAGARALWRATGMKDGDFSKPIIAIANSFTQFVPGHVHLKDLGQLVAREIEAVGGVAKEFNTIAVDDGIAMGHDGMLYSLPSRDIIADSVEYMVNAHCADALVCISNCDKITPGMLMAAMRLNIPVVFVSGGPMEAGKVRLAVPGTSTIQIKKLDLIDAMVMAADDKASDADVAEVDRTHEQRRIDRHRRAVVEQVDLNRIVNAERLGEQLLDAAIDGVGIGITARPADVLAELLLGRGLDRREPRVRREAGAARKHCGSQEDDEQARAPHARAVGRDAPGIGK